MGFAQDITRFIEKTQLRADQVLRKTGLDAWASIMRRSPVDTGRFRANWRIALNRQVEASSPLLGELQAEGGAAMSPEERARAESTLAVARFGDSIHITNNLAYAGPLEDGHSQQAPSGMVAVTLIELQANFARANAALGIDPGE
ncbi:MAG: hypothetical protein RL885_25070 [Planctomycetota bacterium]